MRIYTNPDNKYNELYEVIDQDTQWGVEYIMSLEASLNDLNGCDKYAKQLENEIKSLKRTIDDYKVEITYYRNTINKCNCNSLKETQPPGRIDIFLDTKTK